MFYLKFFAFLLSLAITLPANTAETVASRHRVFQFVYGATITQLQPGAKTRVWIPLAKSNHDQQVKMIKVVHPKEFTITEDDRYGNQIIYFEATANSKGEIPIRVEYLIKRYEATKANAEIASERDKLKFLGSSKMIPVDGSLLKRMTKKRMHRGDAIEKAFLIYRSVNEHMRYDKPAGKPWGRGDALWACDSRYGNCTDFHSIFIGASRDLKIPARFEMGFPIPKKRGHGAVGGYHCWAKFISNHHWLAVDISEANKHPEMKEYYFGNLTEDRVQFTLGRDLKVHPAPVAKSINFLIYPYIEVDGKQHKSFVKQFEYEDVRSRLK